MVNCNKDLTHVYSVEEVGPVNNTNDMTKNSNIDDNDNAEEVNQVNNNNNSNSNEVTSRDDDNYYNADDDDNNAEEVNQVNNTTNNEIRNPKKSLPNEKHKSEDWSSDESTE